jgi:hypothetical protein
VTQTLSGKISAAASAAFSITGHQTSKEVNRYTKAASQKLLATSGMAKLTGNKIVPLAPIETEADKASLCAMTFSFYLSAAIYAVSKRLRRILVPRAKKY